MAGRANKNGTQLVSFSTIDDALRQLRLLGGGRVTDKKAAMRFVTDVASDPKRSASMITKPQRWEELVKAVLHYVHEEVARNSNSKRAQQEDVGLFLVAVVRRAPLHEGAWPLLPLAEALMTEALLRMDHEATAGSALQLLELVLKEAKYCEGLSRRIAEKCLKWLMDSLDDDDQEGAGLGPSSVTRARAFANLVANYRRDFVLDGGSSSSNEGGGNSSSSSHGGVARVVRAVVRFAGRWAGRHGMAEARKAGVNVFPDVAEEVLAALNALLLKYGVDCAPHLAMGGQHQDACYGEAVLNLALQCYPHLHASKAATFLEHMRLQLHLARARLALPHPWALDDRSYVAQNLDKMWQLALQDCLGNAGQHARATMHGAGSRKGRGETWLPLEYKERLTLVFAAEVLYALRAAKANMHASSAGGTSKSFEREEDEEGEEEEEGDARRRGKGTSSKRRRLDDDEEEMDAQQSPPPPSLGQSRSFGGGRGSSGNWSTAVRAAEEQDPLDRIREVLGACLGRGGGASSTGGSALSQVTLGGMGISGGGGGGGGFTQGTAAGGGTGGSTQDLIADRGNSGAGGLHSMLAHLQVLTAVLENLPVGGETWVLDDSRRGDGLVELLGLLEGVLASRGEGVVLLWTIAALLALARVCLRPGLVVPLRGMRAGWSRVLGTLLRPDLKCWASTGRLDAHGLSLGQGVLCLLAEIVRHPTLLGEADLARAQDQLWGLPAFHMPQESAAPVDLIQALLRRGEVLDGPDDVALRLPSSSGAVLSSGARVPCGFLELVTAGGGEGGGGGGEWADYNQVEEQHRRRSLPSAGSRVERVGDFLMAWIYRQLLVSRGQLADRSRAISKALGALLDLLKASRFQLMPDPDAAGAAASNRASSSSSSSSSSPFIVGHVKWSLVSPWRTLAEQQGGQCSSNSSSNEDNDSSGLVRTYFCLHGDRHLWREGSGNSSGAGEREGHTSGAAGGSVVENGGGGASLQPRAFVPALQGVLLGKDGAKVSTAGGQPLRRRGRGSGGGGSSTGGAAETVLVSSSSGVHVSGLATRITKHLEAWTDAACTSLFGSNAEGDVNGGGLVIARGTSTQSTFSVLSTGGGGGGMPPLSEEGARVALLLLVKTLFHLVAVKVDRATVEATEDEEDALLGLAQGVVPMATRIEALLGKLTSCLRRVPWPSAVATTGNHARRRRGGGAGGAGATAATGATDPQEVAVAGSHVLDLVAGLLDDLPLTFMGRGGGSLEQVRLLVESAEGNGRPEEEELPRDARDMLRCFRGLMDKALAHILPRGSGQVIARVDDDDDDDEVEDDNEEEEEGSDDEAKVARAEEDLLMADSDDDDNNNSGKAAALAAAARQRQARGGRVGRGGGRSRGGGGGDGELGVRRGDCALAGEVGKGMFGVQQLAGWARLGLILSPNNVHAHRFVKAAGCLLLNEPGVDLAGLWYDGLFLLTDPEEYVTHLAELQQWVRQDPQAVVNAALQDGMTTMSARHPVGDINAMTVGQEIRLYHLWKLVERLGGSGSPRWLVDGLAPVQDRLWSSFELCPREELSWYNCALETNARRSLFLASEALRGDDTTRKAFLRCLVLTARHGDSEVRFSMCAAFPAVFAVYPNSVAVWSMYCKNGVLYGPGEGKDAEEAPPPITSSQPAPVPIDPVQRRLGLFMALGAVGLASDKVTRLAVLTLCRWWGLPAGATTIVAAQARAAHVVRPMVEAVLASVATGLGYSSTGALLQEHLTFLMHEWLVVLRLPLRDFPLHLVLLAEHPLLWGGMDAAALGAAAAQQGGGEENNDRAEREGTTIDTLDPFGGSEEEEMGHSPSLGGHTEESDAVRQERFLAAFVRRALPTLVPLACLACGGQPAVYRFELLTSLAMAAARAVAEGSSTMMEVVDVRTNQSPEACVADLVETHMVQLKALELLLSGTATNQEAAATQLEDLKAFMRRSLPKAKEGELELGLGFDVAKYPQDVVVAMLDLLGPEPPLPSPPAAAADGTVSSGSALHTLTPAALSYALQALAANVLGAPHANDGRVDLDVLWARCNPVELLLHLKVRLAQATRPARAQRLLELTKELLYALGAAAQKPAVLHLSLHMLLWALERHPDALTLPGLDLLQTYLDASLASSQGAERVGPHLGALVVSLFTVLVRMTGLRGTAGGSGGGGAGDEAEELLGGGSLFLQLPNASTSSADGATSSVLSREDAKVIRGKVVVLLKRLVIQERALKPWVAGLDPLPKLALLGDGDDGAEEEEANQGLEDVRKAIARASSSSSSSGGGGGGIASNDNDDNEDDQQLVQHAKRFAATLAKSAGKGRAGQVMRLVALKALLAHVSPIATRGQGNVQGCAFPRDPGPEVRRLLVPALLGLCRGGGIFEGGGHGGASTATGSSPEETAVRIDAARVLGALGAVPPCELVLWAPVTTEATGPPATRPASSSRKSSGSAAGAAGRRSSGASSPTQLGRPSPLPSPCQAAVGKALKILLGLVTGSDARAVQLAVETLRATLLEPTEEGHDETSGTTKGVKIRPWMEAVWTSEFGPELGFEAQDGELLQSFAHSSTKQGRGGGEAEGSWWQQEAEDEEVTAAASLMSPLKARRGDGGGGGGGGDDAASTRPPLLGNSRSNSSSSPTAWWSRQVWDTSRVHYDRWIADLVWTLIREGIVPGAPAEDEEGKDQERMQELLAVRRCLIQCGPACRTQPALAEALLPLVFLCLLRLKPDPALVTKLGSTDGGSSSSRKRLQQQQQAGQQQKRKGQVLTREQAVQQLTRCLQRCLPRAGPRPLQALIGALTFLRKQSIYEALHHPSLSAAGNSARRAKSRRGGAATADVDPQLKALKAHEAVGAVGGMMGLGLDKLEVARAALRCGALTAAGLYLELHVEDERLRQRGKIRRSGSTTSTTTSTNSKRGGTRHEAGQNEQEQATLLMDEVGEVRSLLLRISGRLAEPDGAEGVLAGTGLEGRTRAAAARECPDWRQALAAHDCLVQQRTQGIVTATAALGGGGRGAAAAAQGGGGNVSSSSISSLSAGPAIALQKLDLGHVLGAYLAGLEARAQGSHEAALRELEFETSWRACRWQKIDTSSSISSALRGPDAFVARHQAMATSVGWAMEEEGSGALRAMQKEEEDLVGGPTLSLLSRQRYHEHVHAGLRALASRDHAGLAHHLRAARLDLLSCLVQEVPSEPSRSLSPVLARLQSLREMEEAAALRMLAKEQATTPTTAAEMMTTEEENGVLLPPGATSTTTSTTTTTTVHRGEALALISAWRMRSRRAIEDDFELVEPVLALREVLLRSLCPPLDARQVLVRHGRGRAASARAAGNLTIATSVMDRVESLLLAPGATTPGALTVDRCACKLEQARILWAKGESDLAIRTAAALGPALESLERNALVVEPRTRGLEVQARQLAGRWMAASRSEGYQRIIGDYLRPAVERAGVEGGTPTQRRRAHLTLASFLAELYQRRSERLKSEEMIRQAALLRQRKAELEATQREYEGLGDKDSKKRDLTRRIATLKKELALDEADYMAQVDSLSGVLLDALRHFRLALCFGGLLSSSSSSCDGGGGGGGGGKGGDGSGSKQRRRTSASAAAEEADEDEDEEADDDSHDDLGPVFRVVALWFEPANAANPAVNAEMAQLVAQVPTYKMVPLIYQILSRLGSGAPEFSAAVEVLVLRTCKEHPHHTLLQLFALRHGKRLSSVAARETYNNIPHLEEKVQAAQTILDRLVAQGGPTLAALVQNTERLLDGYIGLASIKRNKEILDAPRDIPFANLTAEPALVRDFPNILRRGAVGPGSGSANGVVLAALPAVLTRAPKLDPLARYDKDDGGVSTSVVRVERFESRFSLADSGLSRPMILMCVGSDGKRYRQVVKGEDVRSDAIMMQVFETMNTLLSRDPRARRRALHIRTFRVVPLTPEGGVLEFVEQTKTLGAVLAASPDGSLGLHERYNGDHDFSVQECRELLKNARTSQERRDAYQTIMSNFHPAFRFFFLETYPDPALWYRKRLHYTRSVAVSSIVGYVLGIGDRHASNILMDQNTAGLVHIDFGYTFEQGKVLPQPETVPFRLTRDLVDAMGVTGTEGVFRQCCNTTMAVLRQHAPSLLTILEVCVHDPLHSWVRAGLPQVLGAKGAEEGRDEDDDMGGSGGRGRRKAHKVVLGGDGGGGGGGGGGGAAPAATAAATSMRPISDAERALLRIRQKLKGYEDPGGDAMSVEGHVKYLISEATDPDNLCRIYHGWSPWL